MNQNTIRKFIENIIQGIKPSVKDILQINNIKNNLLLIKSNSYEDNTKLQNNIKNIISIISNVTYSYLVNLADYLKNRYIQIQSQYGDTIETYDLYLTEYNKIYKTFQLYTNQIKIIFSDAIKKIDIVYNEEDYLKFFADDKKFVEFMKNLIYMGDKANDVFTYTYKLDKWKYESFPIDFFNILWLYFIINRNYYDFYSLILKNTILNDKESAVEYIIKIKEFDRWHSSKLMKMEHLPDNPQDYMVDKINKSNMEKKRLNDIFKINYRKIMYIDDTIIDSLELFYDLYKDYPAKEFFKISNDIIGKSMSKYIKYLHNIKDIHSKFIDLFFIKEFNKVKTILDLEDIELMKFLGNIYNNIATEGNEYVDKVTKYYEEKLQEEKIILEKKIIERSNIPREHQVIYAINDLYNLINKYLNIVEILFHNKQPIFSSTIHNNLILIMNSLDDTTKQDKKHKKKYILDLLMQYLGIVMKGRLEKFIKIDQNIKNLYNGEYDMNKEFNKIVEIQEYLDDKDEFRIRYENTLSRNIMMHYDEINIENEIRFYNIFSAKIGATNLRNTNKLLMDTLAHNEYLKDYQKSELYKQLKEAHGVEFMPRIYPYMQVNIGKQGYDVSKGLIIPQELKPIIDVYKQDYRLKYPSKKLEFVHKFSKMDIDFINNDNEKYTIICNALQGIILFNLGKEDLTIEEIMEKTNILRDTIEASLAEPLEIGLVKRIGNKYIINDNFKYPRRRIVLKYSITSEEQTKKEIEEITQQEKGFKIDAAIVRVMKSIKKSSLRDLFARTATELAGRFSVTMDEFKRRLDGLIDKDYIKRDDEEMNVFHYVA